jgi:hypothetical protein
MNKIAVDVIKKALHESASIGIPIHTFALYYDHESPALSVCIDTVEASREQAHRFNSWAYKYFHDSVIDGELQGAAKWQANGGRNMDVGGFAYINLQRQDFLRKQGGKRFYQGLLKALLSQQHLVAEQAPSRSDLILCCTGPNYEVEFVWALPDEA